MKHQVSERSRNRAAELCKELYGPTGIPTKLNKLGEWMHDPNAHPYFLYDEHNPAVMRDILK